VTREETIGIMAILRGAYPNFYRDMSKQEALDVVDLWADMFRDDDANVVGAAVKSLIASDTKGYPPHIGAVKAQVQKQTVKERGGRRGAGEAWQRAINAGKVKDAADELGAVSRYAREHGMSWKDAEKYLKEGLI